MTELLTRCRALEASLDDDLDSIAARAQAVSDALARAQPSEVEEAAALLLPMVGDPDPFVASLVAIMLGAAVERGLSPERVGPPIIRRVREELEQARPFHEALVAHRLTEEEQQLPHEQIVQGADYAVPVRTARAIGETMPRAIDAFDALDRLCLPSIACMTRSPEIRAAARADRALVDAARGFRRDVGKWLYQLLVGDADAEWIVLHPGEAKGFVVRAIELNDNWGIQPLLAAALLELPPSRATTETPGLVGGLAGHPPSDTLIACLRGRGPQSARAHASGLWETYTHLAIRPDGTLSESMLDHKIWNEGLPEDIPQLEGHRVIVLSPSQISRSWSATRSYDALGSDIRHLRTLSPAELREWIDRCARAARPS